jgi:hypothetical protein
MSDSFEMQPAEAPMSPPAAEAPAPGSYAALRAAARSGTQSAQAGAQRAGQQASVYAAEKQVQMQAAAKQVEDELGDPALRAAAQQSLEATKARAATMQARGMDAARTAQADASEAASRAGAAAAIAAERTGQMAVATADVARTQFEQRWNDVLAQEHNLAAEAAKLDKYERQLLALTNRNAPNFPPQCCCIEPLVYHDIKKEIGAERQSFVKWGFHNYWLTVFMLVYNCGVAVSMMVIKNKDGQKAPALESHLAISIIMLLGIPLAFVLWYWPVYKACALGSSGQHIMSYIGIVVAIIFNVIVTVGPVGFGGCGLLFGLKMQDAKGANAFYPCLANAIVFGAQTAYFMWMFWRMKCVYGVEDKASLASANAEMARDSVLSSFRV